MTAGSVALIMFAAVETDSSAYKTGQVIGEILIAVLVIGTLVLLIRWIKGQ